VSDIPITFSTNAATTAAQVDKAAASTAKASAAQKAHTTVTNAESEALRRAAAAAREKAAADKQAELAATKAAAADRARAGKAAAFLGVGRGFGGASAVLGAGAGIGSMVAATAAMTALGAGIGLLIGVIGKWIESATEGDKIVADLTKKLDDLKTRDADLGIQAAEKFGPSITALNSLGGDSRDLADEFSKRFGFADASKAVLEARRLFPDNMEAALREANDASRITGAPLSESLSALKGMPVSMLGEGRAAAGVVGQFFGHHIPFDQVTAMRDRSDEDPETLDIRRLQAVGGRLDQFGISNIEGGVQKAIADYIKLTSERGDAEKELTDEIRKQTEATEKLRAQMEGYNRLMNAYYGGGPFGGSP